MTQDTDFQDRTDDAIDDAADRCMDAHYEAGHPGQHHGCYDCHPTLGKAAEPCGRYIATPSQVCRVCMWHRIDHAWAAGGIGNPPPEGTMLDDQGNTLTNLSGHPVLAPGQDADWDPADLDELALALKPKARDWFSRERASTGIVYAISLDGLDGFAAFGRYDGSWDPREAVLLGVFPSQVLADRAVTYFAEAQARR